MAHSTLHLHHNILGLKKEMLTIEERTAVKKQAISRDVLWYLGERDFVHQQKIIALEHLNNCLEIMSSLTTSSNKHLIELVCGKYMLARQRLENLNAEYKQLTKDMMELSERNAAMFGRGTV